MKFYIVIEKGFSREYHFPTYPHGYQPSRDLEGHIFEVNLVGFGESCADLMEGRKEFAFEAQYEVALVEVRYGVDHPKHPGMLRVRSTNPDSVESGDVRGGG